MTLDKEFSLCKVVPKSQTHTHTHTHKTTTIKNCKPCEWGRILFLEYGFIIFKYVVFNNKNIVRHTKTQESMAYSKEQKYIYRNHL